MSSKPSNWPLILIAVALTGAGVSYHFTLDSRFTALEQKLDQNSVALQQYQIAQETTISSKVAALNTLSKEVDVLQASLTPLGKVTKDQTDSLAEIRRQISSLGQLQQAQQDAQKKLADYAGQLEKIKHDIQMREA
jgi:chromosome segregation ATPase